ncbi:MAG: hypothetical protein ACRC8Y_25680 [Chroococcales cyanobacterium]
MLKSKPVVLEHRYNFRFQGQETGFLALSQGRIAKKFSTETRFITVEVVKQL